MPDMDFYDSVGVFIKSLPYSPKITSNIFKSC